MKQRNPIKELKVFMKTLQIHNKDLDTCFNDALAGAHILKLVDEIDKQWQEHEKDMYESLEEFYREDKKALLKRVFKSIRTGNAVQWTIDKELATLNNPHIIST